MDYLTALGQATGSDIAGKLVDKAFEGKNNPPPASTYRDSTYGSIWGKVAAAKAFGVHPLYTLGQPGQSPVLQGQSNSGSTVADNVRGYMKNKDPYLTANLREINTRADRNEAEAAYYNSEAKRRQQSAGNTDGDAAIQSTQDPMQPEKMHSKVQLEDGSQINNPDLAQDVSEIFGYYLNRLLNWQPNMGDLNEVLLGAWKRLGTKQYNKLTRELKERGVIQQKAKPKSTRRSRRLNQ